MPRTLSNAGLWVGMEIVLFGLLLTLLLGATNVPSASSPGGVNTQVIGFGLCIFVFVVGGLVMATWIALQLRYGGQLPDRTRLRPRD